MQSARLRSWCCHSLAFFSERMLRLLRPHSLLPAAARSVAGAGAWSVVVGLLQSPTSWRNRATDATPPVERCAPARRARAVRHSSRVVCACTNPLVVVFLPSQPYANKHPPRRSVGVTFVDRDGERMVCRAPLGQNLLELAHANNVDLEARTALSASSAQASHTTGRMRRARARVLWLVARATLSWRARSSMRA